MQDQPATKPYYDYASLCRAGAVVIFVFQLLQFCSGVVNWVGTLGMSNESSHSGRGVLVVASPSNPLESAWIPVMLIADLALWLVVAHFLFWRSEKIGAAIEGVKHRRASR